LSSVAPTTSLLVVKQEHALVPVPDWYRPGYPAAVRGAAWSRLRPNFQLFLKKQYKNGEFVYYRPETVWLAARVAEQEGTPQIYQELPPPLPSEGEVILSDPEPEYVVQQDQTFFQWLGDRPLILASALALATWSVFRSDKD